MKHAVIIVTLVLISLFSTAQGWMWAKHFNGVGQNQPINMVSDASGNSYVIGNFTTTVNQDAFTLTTFGAQDVFFVKYNKDGQVLWLKQIGGTGAEVASSIAISNDGNFIYVSGTTNGTCSFDGSNITTSGLNDIFLAKYSTSGTLAWVHKSAYGAQVQANGSIAIDKDENIVQVGVFNTDVTFYPGTITLVPVLFPAIRQNFIAKYDSSGNVIWGKMIEGNFSTSFFRSISTYEFGYFFSGQWAGNLYTDIGTYASNSSSLDGFLYKTDTAGNGSIFRKISGADDEYVYRNIIDNNGNVYLTGYFYSNQLTIDSTLTDTSKIQLINVNQGTSDLILLKYNSQGIFQWGRATGTSKDEKVLNIDYSNNKIIITGTFDGKIGFDDFTLINSGGSDAFISECDLTGHFINALQASGKSTDVGEACEYSSNGRNFIAVGDFISDTLAIGTSQFINSFPGKRDCYVAKYGCFDSIQFSVTPVSCLDGMGFPVVDDGAVTATPSDGNAPYTYLWSNSATTQTISNLGLGNFICTVTGTNGCTLIDTAVVGSKPLLQASITNIVNVNCAGTSTGSATVTASFGNIPYSYLWSTGATNDTLLNVPAGTYYVTVSDQCETTIIDTAVITTNPPLTATISGTNVSCYNGNNGTAIVEPVNNNPPYLYNWNTGATTQNIINLVAGTYTVTVTDACNATIIKNIDITEPTLLTASITAQTNVTCNGENNGSATVTASGGTSPYSYLWNDPLAQTTATCVNLIAGTYTVTVTDTNLCTATTNVTITQNSTLTANIASQTNVSCNGGNDGSATVNATGGNFTYANTEDWEGANTWTLVNGTQTNKWYIGTATANGGIKSMYVSNNSSSNAYTITTTSVVHFYKNFTFPLNATNITIKFDWKGYGQSGQDYLRVFLVPTTTTPVAGTQLTSGQIGNSAYNLQSAFTTATITGLDANAGTTKRLVFSWRNNNNTGIQPPAAVDNIIISYTTGGDFLWSNGQTTATATGLVANNYTVTVTDESLCTATTSVTITQPVILSATTNGTPASCNGGSDGTATATPTGGTSPYTYLWQNLQTTQTINGLTAGIYNVTVTDTLGCTVITSYTVTQPAAISLTPSHIDATCGNADGSASIVAANGIAPYTYLWTGGSTNDSITNVLAGAYTVTVTDYNGCTATNTININNIGAPTASIISSTNVTCNGGSNGSATVTASGGTSPYTYLWNDPAPAQTTATCTTLTAGTWTVTVTDAVGCKASASVTITQPAVIASSITTQTNVSCNGGNDGSATVNATGGTFTFTNNEDWEGLNTWNIVNGTQTNKWYLGTATANGGIKSMYVSNNSSSNAYTITSTSVVHFYKNFTFPLNATNITIKFDWKGNGQSGQDYLRVFLVPTTTTPVAGTQLSSGQIGATYNLQGTFITATITGLDANAGTTKRLVFSWRNNNSTGTQPPAAIDNIIISYNTLDYAYLWNDPAPAQTTATCTGLTAGTWTVTVTDANLCTSATSVTITQPTTILSASITATTNVSCNGGNDGSATVTAAGGTIPYIYNWTGGQSTSTATNLAAGAYTVTVTDNNGCTTTTVTTITQPEAVTASIITQTNVTCSGDNNGSATVSAIGGVATLLINEDWEGANTWSLANGTQTNKWYLGTATANGGIKSIYVSNNSSSNAYTINSTSVVHFYKNFTFPSNAVNITIKFDWKGNGQSTIDYLRVFLVPTTTTPVAGTQLTSGQIGNSAYNLQSAFTTATITGLDANAGTTKRLVFSWRNNNSTGTQPPAAIDNIIISYNTTDGYAYSWSTTPAQTTATASNLSAATYTVTVTDANLCTGITSVTITQTSTLTAEISSQTNVSCNGGNDGSATVNATGGNLTVTNNEDWEGANTWALVNGTQTNKWYIGEATANGGLNSIYVSNNSSSNAYTITSTSVVHFYKDFTFPVGATNITIKFDWKGYGQSTRDYLRVFLVPTTTTPVAGTVLTIGQIGSSEYSLQSSFITATITGLDANAGTTKRLVFSWRNNNSTGTQPPAAIDNIIVSYDTPDYIYSWNTIPVQTTATSTALTAGTYTVTVTDASGCTANAIANITQPAALSVSTVITNTSPCVNNGSIMANPANGTPLYTYSWSTGATTQIISGLAAGIYQLTVTDACSATVSSNPTVGTNSIIITSNTECSTPACDGSATANVTGGNAPYTYLWNDALNQTTQTATNLCVATYSVTVTDALVCTSVLTNISVAACAKSTEADITNFINLFPNPASSILTINFAAKDNTYVKLEMYNMFGECVSTETLKEFSGATITKNISSYINGVYLLKLTLDKKEFNRRVVIQK